MALKTIVGLFDTFAQAQTAMRDLESAGVSHSDISLVGNNQSGQYDQYANTSDSTTGSTTTGGFSGLAPSDDVNPIGKDATIGTAIGGGLGLLMGLGLFVIPGFGPIAAAGWLVATVTGAGIGALAGGLVGALTNVGVPEEDAGYYNEGVRRGGTLLAVKAQDAQAHQVAQILSDDGAVNIDERADLYKQEGFLPTPNTAAATTATAPMAAAATTNFSQTPATTSQPLAAKPGEQVFQVVEEDLQVGKREVQRGGVRVYSHMTETPVEQQVSLHEERAVVERRPVDRAANASDLNAFQEGSVEIRETAEEAVVGKTARVVEEVVVGKQASDRTETVRDTVRRTDVEVEQLGTTTTGTGYTETAGHTTRNVTQGAVNAVESTEGSIPGVQTGGRAVDGTPDTRGITEKIADTVTGNRVDDKTGKPV